MNNFYLRRLKILNHGNEICNVDFVDLGIDNRSKPLTTVLIGTNGSGKTYLLRMIADVFNYLKQNSIGKQKFRYEYFYLEYFLNGQIYIVEMKKNKIINCGCDISKLKLPSKVLAVSFMVNDKFVHSDNEDPNNSMYRYLGVRKTSNSTYTSSLVRSVLNNILFSIQKEKTKVICDALSLMKMEHKLSIEINVASKKMANRLNLDADELLEEKLKKNFQNDQDKISKKMLAEAIEKMPIGKVELLFDDLSFKSDIQNLIKYRREINALVDLHILKPVIINFYKKDEKISFEDCSSGEKHIIFAFSSIAINIQDNSIILIDEPEISLHPNWQIKYIHLLKNTFDKYISCHFILATHSHYILSDLEPESSSLVIINRDADDEIQKSELLQYSTYAWSADNIIYNVFGLRTTRNYYFEMDLRELLEAIQIKNTDKNNIKRLYEKLTKYIYDKHDPLNKVLEEVEVFLSANEKTNLKD